MHVTTDKKEQQLNKEDADIIDIYKEQSGKIPIENANGDIVYISGGDIDCVLYLNSIDVVVPVLKGDTDAYLAMYKTVMANNNMVLNKTNYGIMGHHARDMHVSLGGLDGVKCGDAVTIEQNGTFYEYSVDSIDVRYAKDCGFLFELEGSTDVKLFTCDYSLPGNETAYRIVTCKPNFGNTSYYKEAEYTVDKQKERE